jgi:hypothetical protein
MVSRFTPTYFDSEQYYRQKDPQPELTHKFMDSEKPAYIETGSDPMYPIQGSVGYPFSNNTQQINRDFVQSNSLHNQKTINGIPLKDYYDTYTDNVLNKNTWFLNKDLPQETKQYDDNSNVQQRMELFTGLRQERDREILGKPRKTESAGLFKPHERTTGYGYQYGEQGPGYSLSRQKELEDLKKTIKFKTNEKPMETIQVGRGIALSSEVPASGGFHQYTRILPDNVSDYSSNQLPGTVTGGKWVFSNAPTSQAPVIKNKANRYYSLCQYGPGPGRSTITAEATRPDFAPILKNQNRSFINYGFGN